MNIKTKIIIFVSAIVPVTFGGGTYFLLSEITKNLKKTNILLEGTYFCVISAVIIFLVSLAITIYLTCKYFLTEIISPVISIKKELKKIADGDLKNEIVIEGSGEIKELVNELELLRIKLLDSIYVTNKYEDNRKFLLSSISHDLKTPVTSVKGYIEGVLDGVANTPEKIDKYLKTAIEKTEQINFMIDELLLYSKLDLKQIPFKSAKISIFEYIKNLTSEMEMAFKNENKKIIFESKIENNLMVFIDLQRFVRAFQNIVDNAKKHIKPQSGCLKVILREVSASVIIDFEDNGEGILADDLPYIFERFYKANISRTSGGGSGLGLAIAKEIVEGQNGKIWAVNNKNNCGATIKISLKKV